MTGKSIPAVAYVRMSSSKQDKSPEQQREEIIKFALQRGYEIIRWYQDDARSGGKSTEKRKGFLSLLEHAKEIGDFDAVLAWNKSRFDRLDTLEGGEFKMRLRDAGVYLDTIADGKFDWATQEGQIKDAFASTMANQYLLSLSKDVIRGKVSAMLDNRRVLGGQPPYGMARLVIDDKGKERLIPRGENFRTLKNWSVKYVAGDEKELRTLKWIFSTFACQDISAHGLAAKLNKSGISSPAGGLWRTTTIRKILADEAYVGNYVVGKVRQKETFHRITPEGARRNLGPGGRLARTEDGKEEERLRGDGWWEPVIEPKLFHQVQKKLAFNKRNRRKPRSNPYPLSGVVYCGHCGSILLGEVKNLKHGKSVRYLCSQFKNKPGSQCSGWKVDQDQILPLAFDKVMNFSSMENMVERSMESQIRESNPVAVCQKEIEKIDDQIRRGSKRICSVKDDRLVESVLQELERLQSERDRLEEKLKSLHDPNNTSAKITNWRERFRNAMLKYQSEFEMPDENTFILPEMPSATEICDPLVLRQLFLEAGIKVVCYWEKRSHRTRDGIYRLDKFDVKCDLELLARSNGWEFKVYEGDFLANGEECGIDTKSGRRRSAPR